MTKTQIIILAVVIFIALGVVILPLFNRRQFRNLPYDQKIRILMKEAKGVAYFKNVSQGSSGTLYYVKNKRKILIFPWVLYDGKMLVTKENPFEKWDYPEEQEPLNENELNQLAQALENFNKKNPVKIVFK